MQPKGTLTLTFSFSDTPPSGHVRDWLEEDHVEHESENIEENMVENLTSSAPNLQCIQTIILNAFLFSIVKIAFWSFSIFKNRFFCQSWLQISYWNFKWHCMFYIKTKGILIKDFKMIYFRFIESQSYICFIAENNNFNYHWKKFCLVDLTFCTFPFR